MKACALGVAVVLLLVSCTTGHLRDGSVVVTATAVPLSTDPATVAVGELRYRGGVVLTSSDKRFGGLSGLRVRADGWVLAVSDIGQWLGFRLVEQGDRLTGVADFHIAPILDAKGRPAASKSAVDAEALEWGKDGSAIVAMEQDHRIQYYTGIDPSRSETFKARPDYVHRPYLAREWPRNGGMETYASVNPPVFDVMISEEAVLSTDVYRAMVTGNDSELQFGYRAPAGFNPTDAVSLGDGRLLVLHRRFTRVDGASAAITIADFSDIQPDEVIEGRLIARLAPPFTVDNMEGIAVRRSGTRTFIYLISDDNQNKAQRTLLLKFELIH